MVSGVNVMSKEQLSPGSRRASGEKQVLLSNAKPNAPSPLVTPIVPKRTAVVPVFVIVTVCVVVVPTTCVPKLRSKLILTVEAAAAACGAPSSNNTTPSSTIIRLTRASSKRDRYRKAYEPSLPSQRRAADAAHLSRTDLALDALDLGLWARQRAGQDVTGLVHHRDRGVQYRAIRYTERLAEAEAVASVGSRGRSYDNAMAEALNSLFKAECIRNP